MKVPFRPETCSNTGALGRINIFEGRFLFREILHLARAIFKTASPSTVVE